MFWENFSSACLIKNIKPNPLAKKLGIASGTVSSWKSGVVPNGDSLIKIADELNCSIDYLLGRTNNPLSHKNIISTGDISLSDISISNDGKLGIINVHNGESCNEQVQVLLNAFNNLDPFKQAKVLVYVDDLSKTE